MAPSKELTALLFELGRASSPLERMQIIARSWRSVRSLEGSERRELARRVGFDGADELLERLATKGGVAPAALLEALRRARRADPAQLRGILAGLRSPGHRERAVLEGLQMAESVLAPEAGASSQGGDERGDEPVPAATAQAPEPEAEPSAKAEPVPEPEPGPDEIAGAPPTVPPVPAAPPRAAAPAPPPVAPTPRPPSHSLPERPGRPAPPVSPPPAPPTTPARRVRPEPTPEPGASAPAATQLEAPPETTPRTTVLRTLLRLEARLAAATEADREKLTRDALEMPDGWVRRRAVMALLRHGIPIRTADALRLVEGLGSERDRRWALAALLDDRTLATDELEQALALITSEPARRRLRRRSGSARGEG